MMRHMAHALRQLHYRGTSLISYYRGTSIIRFRCAPKLSTRHSELFAQVANASGTARVPRLHTGEVPRS